MIPATSRSESAERGPPSDEARSLSGNQERYWFLDQYENDPSVLNLSSVLDIRGDVSDAHIAAAFQHTIAQHPVLRQRFFSSPAGVRCSVVGSDRIRVELFDASSLDDGAVANVVGSFLGTPLDLQVGDSIRARLVCTTSRRLLCFIAHPCVADLRSLRIIADEFVEALLVAGGWPEAPLEVEYFEKLALSGEREADAERHWLETIGVDPVPLELPRRDPRPARKRFAAQSVRLSIPAAVIEAFDRARERLQIGFAEVCLAGYAALLGRWTQQETVNVGRVANGRSQANKRSVGPFENLLPVRVDFRSQSFSAFVRDVATQLALDAPHETLPFDRIAKLLQKSRDPSRNPVFQAMFRFDEGSPLRAESDSWSVTETDEFERELMPYDLALKVARGPTHATVRIVFDAELFPVPLAQRFGHHFITFLTAVAADPEAPVDRVPILDEAEIRRQLDVLNPAATSQPSSTVLDLFRASVARDPRVPAVSFGGTTLTYRELDRLTDAMAATLRNHGVTRDVCVAVCLERSIGMVTSVLAILKAGGAYVPMDPSYPAERLTAMLEDSCAALVITQPDASSLTKDLPQGTLLLPYDELSADAEEIDCPLEPTPVDAEALAYVIFTSGSTGRPKGVAMPHRALANLIEWQLRRKTFRPQARVLQYSSLSFDVSFQELFSTWASGGHLCLISDEDRRDPRRLLEALEQQRIERLFVPYVALRQMVDVAAATGRAPTALNEVITAGEQLRVDDTLRTFFASLGDASLDNQYGPSETHVVTAHLLEGDPDVGRICRRLEHPSATIRLSFSTRIAHCCPRASRASCTWLASISRAVTSAATT